MHIANTITKSKNKVKKRVERQELFVAMSAISGLLYLFSFQQALGCTLFLLCYGFHPFEDSAKLRILNANYTIPETDREYVVLHDLIRKYNTVGGDCHNMCCYGEQPMGVSYLGILCLVDSLFVYIFTNAYSVAVILQFKTTQ